MPIAIGLLSSQQESFAHHEELSKLSSETDVFYVPFQNDFHNNQDLSNLTKRFDEDILNKHLVVTFRDIGYSLFLDSVQSIPDQNDQTKTRISGKMIVDGICIQFLGCFDCNQDQPDNQQINGIGKVRLDEDYYRELSSTQILIDEKSMDVIDQFEVLTRLDRSVAKNKTRARTISENSLGKTSNNALKSPPSSLSNSRSRLHSPSRYPYFIRPPRTINRQHYQASSPINIESSSVSRSSGFHSSFISPASSVPSSYNDNALDPSHPHIPILSQSSRFSSSFHNTPTMPIRIPSSNIAIPAASLPQFTGMFPMTQSHSLPTYFLPHGNLAYLIGNPNQNSTQPLHLIGALYPPTHYSALAHPQTNSFNDASTKQVQPMETNKQTEEQLPFKKRRYNAGQQSSVHSPMDVNHPDDDDASNESIKNKLSMSIVHKSTCSDHISF